MILQENGPARARLLITRRNMELISSENSQGECDGLCHPQSLGKEAGGLTWNILYFGLASVKRKSPSVVQSASSAL